MLGQIILAHGTANKRIQPFKDGLFILSKSANEPDYLKSVYMPYKGLYLCCGAANNYKILTPSEVEQHVKSQIQTDLDNGNVLSYGLEPFLTIEGYPENVLETFRQRKQALIEQREAERSERLAREEQEQTKRQEAYMLGTQAAKSKLLAGEPICATEFVDLLYRYNVKVSPKTVGSILKSLKTISKDSCRCLKSCKADFWRPFKALQNAILEDEVA